MASSPSSKPRFTPRGGRTPRPAGQRPSSALWYGLALLLLLGVMNMYYLTPGGRPIPYSDFKAALKQGDVADVTIGDQMIRGTLKQAPSADPKAAKTFSTARVDDPKLTEELEARGVKYTGEI